MKGIGVAFVLAGLALSCTRGSSKSSEVRPASSSLPAVSMSAVVSDPAVDKEAVTPSPKGLRIPELPESARACPPDSNPGASNPGASNRDASSPPRCLLFRDVASAFSWVIAHEPSVLAVGEAHAPKGSEAIASATKRFNESMLPLLAGKASDLIVEAWAPDPQCQKEVKAVASAQAPVKAAQAASNPNEYLALGTRAKELGITPYLLRPSCDDFAMLADAGADVIPASLALIERLTEAHVRRSLARNAASKSDATIVTYGGAMHNDLAPDAALRDYSFGPALVGATQGRYVELDLIVPEYVRDTDTWKKLPFYAAYAARGDAERGRSDVLLYMIGDASFTLVFPPTR